MQEMEEEQEAQARQLQRCRVQSQRSGRPRQEGLRSKLGLQNLASLCPKATDRERPGSAGCWPRFAPRTRACTHTSVFSCTQSLRGPRGSQVGTSARTGSPSPSLRAP